MLDGRTPEEGDRGARPAGEPRRMSGSRRCSRCSARWPACGLQPLYAGGGAAPVATALNRGAGRPDRGQGGLAGRQCAERSLAAERRAAALSADGEARRRPDRARAPPRRHGDARAPDAAGALSAGRCGRGHGAVDATAGSDVGVDVVGVRICDDRRREHRARAAVRDHRRSDRRAAGRCTRGRGASSPTQP